MRDYALVQQSVADPPMMLAARRVGAVGMMDGEESGLEEAIEVLKAGMAAAMNNADQLRCLTVAKVVEILTPSQAIKVLRNMGQLHLRFGESPRKSLKETNNFVVLLSFFNNNGVTNNFHLDPEI